MCEKILCFDISDHELVPVHVKISHFVQQQTDRSSIFTQSQQAQELEFLRADTNRWELADARAAELNSFLERSQEIFLKSQDNRVALYEVGETKRDEATNARENNRWGIFEKGMKKHEEIFEDGFKRRERDAEWSMKQRASLVERGVKQRDDECKDTLQAFTVRFDNFTQDKGKSFVEIQRGRSAVVKELLTRGIKKPGITKTSDAVSDESVDDDPRMIATHTTRNGNVLRHRISVETVCVLRRSYSPQYNTGSRAPTPSSYALYIPPLTRQSSPLLQPVVITPTYATLFNLNPVTIPPQSSAEALAAGSEKYHDFPKSMQQFSTDSRSLVEHCDSMFYRKQDERLQTFNSAQKRRNSRFELAEKERDKQTPDHWVKFNSLCWTQFRELLSHFDEMYKAKERSREEHHQMTRQKTYENTKMGFETRFETQLQRFKKQFDISEELSTAAFKLQKNEIHVFFTSMEAMVGNMIKAFDDEFEAFLEDKEKLLGVARPLNSTSTRSPSPERFERVHSRRSRSPTRPRIMSEERSYSPQIIRTSRSFASTRSRSPSCEHPQPVIVQPPGRNMEPETFFAPRLFSAASQKKSVKLSEQDKNMLKISFTFERHHKKFIQSEESRWHEFKKQMEDHCYVFSVNEFRRQRDFKNSLSTWKDSLRVDEEKRQSEFMAAERNREVTFWRTEEKRCSDFLDEERSRNLEFKREEDARSRSFNNQQSEITKLNLIREQTMQEEFAQWKVEVLRKMEGCLKRYEVCFEKVRQRHEEMFNKMLELVTEVSS
ncbi:hypothetical protein ABKN59_009403 [Abortiporus biennis]